MNLRSEIRFADEKIRKAFFDLEKDDKKLFLEINSVLDKIENNVFSGIQIPKKLIPKYYIKKYGVKFMEI